MSTSSSSDSSDLATAKQKLAQTNAVSYENLPTDRIDPLWIEIRENDNKPLSLNEISALKNAVCQGKSTLTSYLYNLLII